MFNYNKIAECLTSQVGFRNEDGYELPTTLTESKSGLYFQGAHPLVTLQNIQDVAPQYDETDNAKFYEWLSNARTDAIQKVFASVFTSKKLDERAKTIFEDLPLFDAPGNIHNKEMKQGRFVGYQFALKEQQNILALIRSIGTQFDAEQDSLILYCYHSDSRTPIPIDLAITDADSPQWHEAEVKLEYMNKYQPGGVWFIGYYEDDLVGQAINRADIDFSGRDCGCGGRERYNFVKYSKILSVSSFYVDFNDLQDDRTLWNIKNNRYAKGKTWGINLKLSTECELSDVICRHGKIFSTAIWKQFAYDMLLEMANSTRTNRIQEKTAKAARFALTPEGGNFAEEVSKVLKSVDVDFSGIPSLCLPRKGNGIRYGAIG